MQTVFDPSDSAEAHRVADQCRSEFVVRVTGQVTRRLPDRAFVSLLGTRASHLERTVSKEAWTPLDPLEAGAQLRRCDIEQREVVLGQPPVPARANCQRADPFISDSEPADFDPAEAQRSD